MVTQLEPLSTCTAQRPATPSQQAQTSTPITGANTNTQQIREQDSEQQQQQTQTQTQTQTQKQEQEQEKTPKREHEPHYQITVDGNCGTCIWSSRVKRFTHTLFAQRHNRGRDKDHNQDRQESGNTIMEQGQGQGQGQDRGRGPGPGPGVKQGKMYHHQWTAAMLGDIGDGGAMLEEYYDDDDDNEYDNDSNDGGGYWDRNSGYDRYTDKTATPANDNAIGQGQGYEQSISRGIWANKILRNSISSTIGACVTALVVTPLDVVKVRMQTHTCIGIGVATSAAASHAHPNTYIHGRNSVPFGSPIGCKDPSSHFKSVFDALIKIPKQHGIKELWRGLNTTMILAVPTTGLYFTLYESLQTYLTAQLSNNNNRNTNTNAPNNVTASFVAGMMARTATALVAAPLDLARTRAQANVSSATNSAFRDLALVAKSQGYSSLFRGLGPTLLRDVPFSAVYWALYERLKARNGILAYAMHSMQNQKQTQKQSVHGSDMALYLISGSLAGMVAASITTPADVVKTRQQAERFSPSQSSASMSPTIRDTIRSIYAQEGLKGFARGLGARVAKVTPACAIMMGSYEIIRDLFATWENEHH